MLTKSLNYVFSGERYGTWLILAIAATFLPVLNAWFGYCFDVRQEFYSAIGGVIPYSDAHGYWHGACRYDQLGILDGWNMRRPLNALFFAFRLKLMNGNFWYAMIFQSTLCAIPFFFYMRLLQSHMGSGGAFVGFLFVFVQIFYFGATTLSEMLGLILGLSAFYCLWIGWFNKDRLIYNIGFIILTIALSTRAGPQIMILAALFLVWLSPFTQNRWKDLALSFSCFFITFYFMCMLPRLFGESCQNMALSNFSYTIYGLVKGGKAWSYYLQDDRVMSLIQGKSEAETSIILYRESWLAFKENPFDFIKGTMAYLNDFFRFLISWLNSIHVIPKFIAKFASIALWLLLVWRMYSKKSFMVKEKTFLLSFFLAIMLSAMIVFRDGGIRSFMVAIPFWGALLALTFAKEREKAEIKGIKTIIGLVLFIVVGALSQDLFHRDYAALSDLQCDDDILISRNLNKMPFFKISDDLGFGSFSEQKREMFLMYEKLGLEIYHLARKGVLFCWIYDYRKQSYNYCYGDPKVLETKASWVSVKVRRQEGRNLLEILEVKELRS